LRLSGSGDLDRVKSGAFPQIIRDDHTHEAGVHGGVGADAG